MGRIVRGARPAGEYPGDGDSAGLAIRGAYPLIERQSGAKSTGTGFAKAGLIWSIFPC